MKANMPQDYAAKAPAKEAADVRKADKYIWAIYIALLVVSVVELYSASSREVQASNVFGPLLRHGKMLVLGAGITIGLSRMKFKWIIHLTPIFALFSLVIGFYVFFNGQIINGARRSMTLLGIPLQSAELLKLAVVLFIAYMMTRKTSQSRGVKNLGIVFSAGYVLICCGLLVTQGLTNTLLLMGVSFAMMLIAGVDMKRFMLVIVSYAAIGGVFMAFRGDKDEETAAETTAIMTTGRDLEGNEVTHARQSTWMARIDRWLGDTVPKYEKKIDAKNRQEMYSYFAQANGGLHGVLPGNSRETARLPLAFSDYIFAIIVEDWGFIGGMGLLILYLCLLGRAGVIAARCSHVFPALLVMGMAVMIVLQALFHMAIVTGVFPVSGQPLPMISKGGTSIIATSIAFGLMLAVSRFASQSNKKKEIMAAALDLPEDMDAVNPGKIN
ncbi:MAG: FtsW/RodA/SpoVE family cell cycle protein [[Clostridium] fimetarium]|nr:FtsW/RodA/SpoVE family cell cycle protein [Alistipes timonensis]MCM1406804.1 FtsW/RodA/SpoVE family cell cycle protein [[Clostridium] fimetarium]